MARRAYQMIRAEKRDEAPAASPREVVNIREALDEMGVARCPLCRMVLIARMRRGRPGFHCRCPKRPAQQAA